MPLTESPFCSIAQRWCKQPAFCNRRTLQLTRLGKRPSPNRYYFLNWGFFQSPFQPGSVTVNFTASSEKGDLLSTLTKENRAQNISVRWFLLTQRADRAAAPTHTHHCRAEHPVPHYPLVACPGTHCCAGVQQQWTKIPSGNPTVVSWGLHTVGSHSENKHNHC